MVKVEQSSDKNVGSEPPVKEAVPKEKLTSEKIVTPKAVLKQKKQAAKQVAHTKAGPKSSVRQPKPRSQKIKTEPVKSKAKRRSRLERRGKKYRQVIGAIESGRTYSLDEAIELLPKTSFAKFDVSVEVHIPLSVDPKQSDQLVRGIVVLPHGSGKTNRVAVVTTEANQPKAKAAGADKVGEEDLLEEVKAGKFDFDILVATPDVMPKLAKYAKELGPKGLMPNPKSGTVTTNIAKTVKELKGGKVEFRVDPTGIIHQVVGKLSFKPDQLKENLVALFKAVKQARPASIKGAYVKKIWLTTSMGPSLKIDKKALTELK